MTRVQCRGGNCDLARGECDGFNFGQRQSLAIENTGSMKAMVVGRALARSMAAPYSSMLHWGFIVLMHAGHRRDFSKLRRAGLWPRASLRWLRPPRQTKKTGYAVIGLGRIAGHFMPGIAA